MDKDKKITTSYVGGSYFDKQGLVSRSLFYGFASSLSFVLVEINFAEAHRFGGYFHVLILFDIFESFFQAEQDRWGDICFLVGTAGSHVVNFLDLQTLITISS